MKPFCENIATEFLPAVRSIVTRELIDNHGLTQKEVARLLGLTQPAVSQYLKQSRGSKIKLLEKNPEVIEMIRDLTGIIKNEKVSTLEITSNICSICKKIREGNNLGSGYINTECPLEV